MASLVQLWTNKHLIALGITDFNDPENSFDMDLLYEMVAHELMKWQMAAQISKKGTYVENIQTSATLQGDPLFEDVVNPLLEHIQIHSRITLKLKEALVATRQAQLAAGNNIADPNIKTSNLAQKARDLMKQRLQAQKDKDIKDATFEVKE
jgi:hypothetical protein